MPNPKPLTSTDLQALINKAARGPLTHAFNTKTRKHYLQTADGDVIATLCAKNDAEAVLLTALYNEAQRFAGLLAVGQVLRDSAGAFLGSFIRGLFDEPKNTRKL